MWNLGNVSNETVRRAYTNCRNRMRISMYRTRNPLDIGQITYALSFLFAPGGRTREEHRTYFGFKTMSTPRNTDATFGASLLQDEASAWTYPLNIIVINTINNKEVGDAYFESLLSSGAHALNDYTVALTLSPYHRVQLVYREVTIDDEVKKYYYLFTNKMSDTIISRLAGCMCAHMNLFGEFNDSISTALLQELQVAYEDAIIAYAETATAAEYLEELRNTLESASVYGSQRMINRVQTAINNKQNNITDYITSLTTLYNEVAALQQQLLGLQHASSNENELSQFLLGNINNITYAKLYDNCLFLRYRTPLLYWDEDVFKILRESSNSNPMRPQNAAYQQLVDDIFDKRTVVLWIDSGVRYNLTDSGFRFVTMENEFSDVPAAKGLPNPHHYYYNCWGDNEPRILQAQRRGDSTVALAQIFAAIAGINLSDSIVLRRFVEEEWNSFRRIKCLEIKETHELISIEEYVRRYNNA